MSMRRRIFIVEDEALIAMELEDHLRSLGYEVCGHAARGAAALKRIPEARPDLIVLDINLGSGMTGIEVAERLRGEVDAPIVFLTAYSDVELTERAARTDSFAYLVKPYQPEALRANIELALCKHAAQRQLAEANRRLDLANAALTAQARDLDRSYALLQAAFEATSAGLVVVEGGAVKAANRRLYELWRLPDDLTEASDGRLPAWMRAHLQAPADADPLGGEREPRELVLRDGRIVERSVRPLAGDAAIAGHLIAFRDVTRQRRAEAALRESEELHRALFEHAPVGLAIAGRDGEVLLVNPALVELAGVGRPELRELEDVLVGAGPVGEGAALCGRGRAGEVVDREPATLRRRDGEVVDALVSLRPLTVDARPAVLAMIEDVTERKRHDEALAVLSGALARLSGEAFFVAAAREVARLLGVDAAVIAATSRRGEPRLEALGLWIDGQAGEALALTRAGSSLAIADGEGAAIHADGVDVDFPGCELARALGACGVVSVALQDGSGGELGVIAALSRQRIRRPRWVESMLRLFAARVAAEIERQREMARFHDLFEFSPDAVLLVREDGVIALANRQAVALFGYTREELIGMAVEALIPAAQREQHVRLRRRFHAAATPRRMGSCGKQLVACCKDGAAIPVDIGLGPLRASEEPVVIVAVRDLRERREIESERRALEVQLRHSQKMETLGTLAGGVAHDFNNLLSVIVANVECLQRELLLSGVTTARLDAVVIAAARATSLVQRILAFTRRQPAKRAVTSLGEIVREVVELLRPALPARIRLDVAIADDAPPVYADPTHLHQIVINLVTNASHAIGDGAGVITIAVEAGEMSGDAAGGAPPRSARLTVRDDGQGISPAILERIFEPFFTTKPVGQGSGLGLSVVQGIVKEQGGTISVASELGGGAAFFVELPAASEATREEEVVGEPPRGRGHVLFLDDEELLVSVGEVLLGRLGYTVTGFSRAGEALAAIAEEPRRFDFVITDFNMPEASGIEVAREVARLTPGLPVILASGSGDRGDDELETAGIRHRISKPYGTRELAEVLARARGGGTSRGRASERVRVSARGEVSE